MNTVIAEMLKENFNDNDLEKSYEEMNNLFTKKIKFELNENITAEKLIFYIERKITEIGGEITVQSYSYLSSIMKGDSFEITWDNLKNGDAELALLFTLITCPPTTIVIDMSSETILEADFLKSGKTRKNVYYDSFNIDFATFYKKRLKGKIPIISTTEWYIARKKIGDNIIKIITPSPYDSW